METCNANEKLARLTGQLDTKNDLQPFCRVELGGRND